ncbi:MAG: hypothetical protein AMJ91_01435 [candidate division Zixibacteria bacterium SM23_73_3]|nr:MAG: hypothetical protein AMJ91_01435 [candidate division Zixibacteria bacterium SM23_73_3]
MLGISKLLLNLQERNLEMVIGLFILAILFAIFTYRHTFPPLSKRKKTLLLALRIVALFSLFLVLSEPILTIARRHVQKPVIALLLDTSGSMNLKGTDIKRIEALQNLLKNDIFKKISYLAELKTFGFADSLIPMNLERKFPDSLGNATSIGDAIELVVKKLSRQNLRGIVILSDGANNLGEDPVLVARSTNIPIYTRGVGEYIPPKDVSIERMVYNDIAYVDDQIPVQVDISQTGFDQLKIPVSIKEKKNTLAQQNLNLGKSGATQTVDLTIIPKEAGLHRYDLAIPVLDGESVKENNRRSFTIKVLKSKIAILLISGSLNWEYTFLKRALEKDKNIELKTLVYGTKGQPVLGRFPQGEKQLSLFDILIFIDPPGFILKSHEKEIEDFVFSKGGSTLFLLGKEFMDTHGFMETSSLLPFDPAGRSITFSSANINLKLTEEGKLHPVTRLVENSEENEKIWSDLPPFLGVVILGSVTKDASNLAGFRNPQIPDVFSPGIVVRNYGKGKVMAITTTPFWRWDFLLWGIGKDNQIYQTFWNNSVRWLVVREDMDLINLFTDKKIYKGGERITFKAKIFDQNYQKIGDASVGVNIKGEALPDSELVNLSLDELGNYTATLRALPPGRYSFEGKVFRDGKKLGVKKGEFLVEEYSVEDSDLKTDFDLLKRIAEVSGGEYYQKEQIENLTGDLNLVEKEKQKTKEIQLWNHPLLLAIFVLCLSIEWAVRKRSQLL